MMCLPSSSGGMGSCRRPVPLLSLSTRPVLVFSFMTASAIETRRQKLICPGNFRHQIFRQEVREKLDKNNKNLRWMSARPRMRCGFGFHRRKGRRPPHHGYAANQESASREWKRCWEIRRRADRMAASAPKCSNVVRAAHWGREVLAAATGLDHGAPAIRARLRKSPGFVSVQLVIDTLPDLRVV